MKSAEHFKNVKRVESPTALYKFRYCKLFLVFFISSQWPAFLSGEPWACTGGAAVHV